LFNEFVLKEYEIVENDNLVYSSEIASLSTTLFPSYKVPATALSFVASYTGFEYLGRNDVDIVPLMDKAFQFGIASGSGFVALSHLRWTGIFLALSSVSLPYFKINPRGGLYEDKPTIIAPISLTKELTLLFTGYN